MKTENKVLMQMAKDSLRNNWGKAVGVSFITMVIFTVFGFLEEAGSIITLLIVGPFSLGLVVFYLAISRGQEAKIEQIFFGFNLFTKALGAYLLMILYIFLWSLLLIVPGIIATYSYSMVFFILADDNNIKVKDALRKSKEIMNGYKLKYFYLNLRFIGWGILSLLTLGIGFLWLIPWMQTSQAKFYDDIKSKNSIKTNEEDVSQAPFA